MTFLNLDPYSVKFSHGY